MIISTKRVCVIANTAQIMRGIYAVVALVGLFDDFDAH